MRAAPPEGDLDPDLRDNTPTDEEPRFASVDFRAGRDELVLRRHRGPVPTARLVPLPTPMRTRPLPA